MLQLYLANSRLGGASTSQSDGANRGPFGVIDPAVLAALLGDSDNDTDSMHEGNSGGDFAEASGCLSVPYNAKTREVAVTSDTIDGKECKILVILDPGARGCFPELLDTVHVVCKINGKEIGHAAARFVRKDQNRQSWWDTSKPASNSLQGFHRKIYDRYGKVMPEHTDDPYLKSTGVWGAELTHGDILFWDHFDSIEHWRVRGLDTLLLKHVRQAIYSSSEQTPSTSGSNPNKTGLTSRNPRFEMIYPKYGYVMPGLNGMNERQAEQYKKDSKIEEIDWLHSLGFRRIGLTDFFGYANDSSHPSRSLAASLDKTIPEKDAGRDENETERAIPHASSRRESPLIYAVMYLSDSECVTLFKTKYPVDSPQWKLKEEVYVDTVLHRAAVNFKPRSVKWIMENIDPKLKLSAEVNFRSLNPLQDFTYTMDEIYRTGWDTDIHTKLIQDQFAGYSSAIAQTFAALKGYNSPSATQLSKLKYGCTCDECLGGVLSPHVRVIVAAHAKA